MKAAWVVLALALVVSLGLAGLGEAATAVTPESGAAANRQMFERNAALGAVLETRAGTPAELGELRTLADQGLKAAQERAAKQPESADAQYLLGSWLLYAYRVVEVDQISFDAQGGARTETVSRVIMGLSDDPAAGLEALKKAAELAPRNGEFLLDYGAALADYAHLDEARGVLKGIWAGQPELSQAEKMRAGFLLSGVSEAEGDLAGAREWIYSALSLDPAAAEAVERLRHLDAEEVAAAAAASVWEEEPSTGETPSDEGVAPAPDESDVSTDQGATDESSDGWYDEGSTDGSSDGSYDEGSGDGSSDGFYNEGSGDGSSDGSSDAGGYDGESYGDGAPDQIY